MTIISSNLVYRIIKFNKYDSQADLITILLTTIIIINFKNLKYQFPFKIMIWNQKIFIMINDIKRRDM